MAELDYAIMGDYARVEAQSGLLTVVGGGFDRVTAGTLPTQYVGVLALRVLLDEDEDGVDLEVVVEAPDDNPILRLVGRAERPEDAVSVAGKAGAGIVAPLPLGLAQVGTYWVKLHIQGKELKRIPFIVVSTGEGTDTPDDSSV